MLEFLKYDFFQNALLSTVLIGISCGLVGTYIVAKRNYPRFFRRPRLCLLHRYFTLIGSCRIFNRNGHRHTFSCRKQKNTGRFFNRHFLVGRNGHRGTLYLPYSRICSQPDVLPLRQHTDGYLGTNSPFRFTLSGDYCFLRIVLPSAVLYCF